MDILSFGAGDSSIIILAERAIDTLQMFLFIQVGKKSGVQYIAVSFHISRGPSKRPRSADFLNNVLCVPYVTS